MSRTDDYPNPESDPEAEGLPGTADDDSTADPAAESGRGADGMAPAALPSDVPLGLDRYGTTAEETRLGEPLDYKLAQEEPDVGPDDVPTDRGLAADEEVGETGGVESAGPGAAAEVVGERVDPALDELWPPELAEVDEPPVEPHTDSAVSMYDRPGIDDHVGRLVQPDEGAHPDEEKDEIAFDAGTAGGGASAEELAMHEEPQP